MRHKQTSAPGVVENMPEGKGKRAAGGAPKRQLGRRPVDPDEGARKERAARRAQGKAVVFEAIRRHRAAQNATKGRARRAAEQQARRDVGLGGLRAGAVAG